MEKKPIIDEVSDNVKTLTDIYNGEDLKDIRFAMAKLRSEIDYHQYHIYCRNEQLTRLNKKYLKMLGIQNETTKEK